VNGGVNKFMASTSMPPWVKISAISDGFRGCEKRLLSQDSGSFIESLKKCMF
jgi:hypothetical protein